MHRMDESAQTESNLRKGSVVMNSLKDRLHFITAILLLLLIGFTVWYVLFYLQGPEVSTDGTLVYREIGRLVGA